MRHDYATDVLTFDSTAKDRRSPIEGEIIISVQTAKQNAVEYGVNLKEEIMLYMIHGVLHLLGYEDHSLSGIKKMRKKEKDLMSLANSKMDPRSKHSGMTVFL